MALLLVEVLMAPWSAWSSHRKTRGPEGLFISDKNESGDAWQRASGLVVSSSLWHNLTTSWGGGSGEGGASGPPTGGHGALVRKATDSGQEGPVPAICPMTLPSLSLPVCQGSFSLRVSAPAAPSPRYSNALLPDLRLSGICSNITGHIRALADPFPCYILLMALVPTRHTLCLAYCLSVSPIRLYMP